MWVGQTYYFTWLDGQFGRLAKNAAADGTTPSLWMVHSGGFYTVDRQKSLKVGPEQVHWFRWEALMTWLSGVVLLFLVYYSSSGLIDADVANISQAAGVLHSRQTEIPEGRARAGSLVPLGSIDDLVERSRAAFPRLLFQQNQ